MQVSVKQNNTQPHGPRAKSLLTGKTPSPEYVPPAPLDDDDDDGQDRRKCPWMDVASAAGTTIASTKSMRHILSLSPIALSQELGQRRLLTELHQVLRVLTPHVALTTEAEQALAHMHEIVQKLQQQAEQQAEQQESREGNMENAHTHTNNRGIKQQHTIQEELQDDELLDETECSDSAPIKVIQQPNTKVLPPSPLSAPQYTLYVHEKTPEVEPFPHVTLHRGTYAANQPSEDRSTVVVGQDFIWAGVFDGHGGSTAAHFCQRVVFDQFRQAVDQTTSKAAAFHTAFTQTDRAYYHHVTQLQKQSTGIDGTSTTTTTAPAATPQTPAMHFAGTCAIACFIDIRTGTITCANLGDSRAVAGVWNDDTDKWETLELSTDHSANNVNEQERIRAQHASDKTVLVQEEPGDNTSWRVKGIAAFTRSIGDLHLKEKNTAALFNSYVPAQQRIFPRPGIKDKDTGLVKPKYISTEPDVQEAVVRDGFLIIASDGVWDEMSSDQAVQTVAKLTQQYDSTQDDIAALFIKEVLKCAVRRISTEHEDEKDLTLPALKARPAGKSTDQHRAMLHDDITVVIVQLGRDKQMVRQFESSWSTVASEEEEDTNNSRTCDATAEETEMSISDLMSEYPEVPPNTVTTTVLKKSNNGSDNLNNSQKWHNSMSSSFSYLMGRSVGNIWGWFSNGHDPQRQSTDTQILKMMSAFDGLQTEHLSMLFNAVDADENGTLDREEVTRLIKHVIHMDVTSAVVDLAFSEMDQDGSGDVDFEEFSQFFGR
eukprot:scaffold1143_cov177-Amphora_coffeaeformis.AAC.6